MKILIPDHVVAGPCKWIYPITFGGGLVGGDSMKLDIHIGEGCCALLTSQESTKVRVLLAIKYCRTGFICPCFNFARFAQLTVDEFKTRANTGKHSHI